MSLIVQKNLQPSIVTTLKIMEWGDFLVATFFFY